MSRFDDEAMLRLEVLVAGRAAVEIDAPEQRRAAVLIPFVRRDGGWSVLLTKRSEDLVAHRGQIAFPGGSAMPGEPLDVAAIREAEEEVGIPAQSVKLLGRLDDVVTNSGFLVAPFVAAIREPVAWVPQQSEVAEVFEVPVDDLLAPHQPEVRFIPFRKKSFPAYFYTYGSYEIWGLTGRMLKATLDLVWQSL